MDTHGRRGTASPLQMSPRLRGVLLASLTVVLVLAAARAVSDVAAMTRSVLVPVALAVLLTGLLMPLQLLLNHRLHLNRHLAALVTLVVGVGGVGVVIWFAGRELANGVAEVRRTASFELSAIKGWIVDSPIPVGRETLNDAVEQLMSWLNDNSGRLAEGALGAGTSAASFLFGAFLCLITVFFLLAQGDRIAAWLVLLLPASWRERTFESGRRGWVTVGTYSKMQAVISGADAVGIGLGVWALGLPFVLPLTAITFVLCFIPVVGAVVSGALVVLVALAFKGTTAALVALVIVIAVQQLESDVLAPLLMSKAVNVHPVAVLIGLAAGSYVLGFIGALFAVPVMATVNSVASYLAGRDPFPGLVSGGSALTDSPRTLARDTGRAKLPPRLGQANPDWLTAARHPAEEENTSTPRASEGTSDEDRAEEHAGEEGDAR